MQGPRRLELVTGRAGAGKTEWVLQQIMEEVAQNPAGPPVWWVVPPHLTYETERRLLSACDAVLRVEVLTPDRLAQRLLPPVLPWRPLNQTGARLLMAEVLERLNPELRVLRRETTAVAFLDTLLEMMRELTQSGVVPDALLAWLEQSATARVVHPLLRRRPLLMAKMQDIARIYAVWSETLEVYGFYDPHGLPAVACRLASQWPDIRGMWLMVDGFTDMTPQVLELVREVSRRAARTVVTLRLDPAAEQELAATDWQPERPLTTLLDALSTSAKVVEPEVAALYLRLRRLAAEEGMVTEVVHLTGGARFQTPDLAGVEKFLADAESAGLTLEQGVDLSNVMLVAAPNPRVEVEGAVQTLLNWAVRDGIPWQEMLLLVPDLEAYGPLLRARLAEQGILAAVDEYPVLTMHPLGKYLLAVLHCAETGLTVENSVRLLKTEFCGLSRTEADWLEQYLVEHEVPPTAWTQDDPWTFAQTVSEAHRLDASRAADQRADALRRRVAEVVLPALQRLQASALVPAEVADALWQALAAADAKRRVAAWIVNERAEWTPLEASQHEQAWNAVVALLEDLARHPGARPLPRTFLFDLVRRGLSDQRLTTIPAQSGALRVTDFARADGVQADAVVVLGAVDGALPRRVHIPGLLGDDERQLMAEAMGLRIGYTTDERQLMAQGLPYVVLTRARERLLVARPLSGFDGKACRPALVVTRLSDGFGQGLREGAWFGFGQAGEVWTERRALRWLIDQLRTDAGSALANPLVLSVLRWFDADTRRRTRLRQALAGLSHQARAHPLPPALARALFGVPLELNPYQVEAFAACPYRHFLAYGLRLSEARPPEPDAARQGALIHDALHAFVARHRADPGAWRSLSDEAAVQSMQEVFARVLERPVHAVWLRTAARRRALVGVERMLALAALALTRQVRRGQYLPVELETSFGMGGAVEIPPLTWRTGDAEVRLRGRIDRIDVAEANGRKAFRIVDYKSGDRRLHLEEVAHGLGLQLLLYWLAVDAARTDSPLADAEFAGVMVMPVSVSVERNSAPHEPRKAREEALRRMASRPWLVDDRDLVLWMDVQLGSGGSELFPAVYRQDGEPRSGAPVFSRDDWSAIRQTVTRHLRDVSKRILNGDIAISPYRLKEETACTHCPYTAVCQIDPRWDPSPVRVLAGGRREEWLRRWREAGGADEEDER